MQEIYRNKALKVSGKGHIEYCLKVDSDSKLYIEILNNSESGTYQQGSMLFQSCLEMAQGNSNLDGNNNNKSFYEAILRQLGTNVKGNKND